MCLVWLWICYNVYCRNYICNIYIYIYIYVCVLCTDDVIILMYHCVLLARPDILLYWMIVSVYLLYYMCMQVISHFGSIYIFYVQVSISLYPLSYNIKTKKGFILVMHPTPGILIICCILMCCPICSSVFLSSDHWLSLGHIWVVILATGITPVGDARCVLGVVIFHRCFIYICLCCFSHKQSHTLMVTISLGYLTYPSWSCFDNGFFCWCLHVCLSVFSDIVIVACLVFIFSLYPSGRQWQWYVVYSLWSHDCYWLVFKVSYSHIALNNGLWAHWVCLSLMYGLFYHLIHHASTVIR